MTDRGPLRAFRDRYVAAYGGVSYDLAPRAVGVHPDHLRPVPELAMREVLVSTEQAHPGSVVHRPSFTVVPLVPLMQDAWNLAAEGGVVFSSFDLDDPRAEPVLGDLQQGDAVYLNSALSRLGFALRRPDYSAA